MPRILDAERRLLVVAVEGVGHRHDAHALEVQLRDDGEHQVVVAGESAIRCSTKRTIHPWSMAEKNPRDVGIEHPPHVLPLDSHRQRVERIVRSAPRSESVGEAEKVRLVDRVKHPGHSELHQPRRDIPEGS